MYRAVSMYLAEEITEEKGDYICISISMCICMYVYICISLYALDF